MSKAHPGFQSVKASIAHKEGISSERAGAILGAATRHASAAAKRANPRLKRVKGKMHEGGVVPESGLYEMQKGEKVIPAGSKMEPLNKDGHYVSHTSELDTAHAQEVPAFPNGPDATGPGHWEINGTDVKFVK